ncbi:MAG: FAD-dependent oxidoreductase [Tannerella sp.]|jgi:hypothetical protein|nr:FAD-dependent oxidoreductase [Tannerella sp.]
MKINTQNNTTRREETQMDAYYREQWEQAAGKEIGAIIPKKWVAAAVAIRQGKSVQDIDRNELIDIVKKYGQKLEWDGYGYRTWRYNVLGRPVIQQFRWDTHLEEYQTCPVDKLRK